MKKFNSILKISNLFGITLILISQYFIRDIADVSWQWRENNSVACAFRISSVVLEEGYGKFVTNNIKYCHTVWHESKIKFR